MLPVLLINPRSSDLYNPAYWPPLGILYVGTALQQHGHDVRVVDMAVESLPERQQYTPTLIGVSCTTPNYVAVQNVIRTCRDQWPGVPIVVGGPHVSITPEDGERLGVDVTVVGDGEVIMARIAAAVEQGAWPWHRLRLQAPSVDINQVPIPNRDLLRMERYTAEELGGRATSLITQRGCPYSCAYCCKWNGYGRVRYRDLDNVVQEVGELWNRNYRVLRFFDDELNLNEKRLLELCDRLCGTGMAWTCLVRSNLFNEKQAEAMVRAGCRMVQNGVESGSDRVLTGVHKQCSVADHTQARAVAKKFGLQFWAFFVVGLPGESPETVQETAQWIRENRPDRYSVYTFQPYPGTDVYQQPQNYDIKFSIPLPYTQTCLGIRGTEESPLRCLVSTSQMRTEDIVAAREYLDKELRKELGL